MVGGLRATALVREGGRRKEKNPRLTYAKPVKGRLRHSQFTRARMQNEKKPTHRHNPRRLRAGAASEGGVGGGGVGANVEQQKKKREKKSAGENPTHLTRSLRVVFSSSPAQKRQKRRTRLPLRRTPRRTPSNPRSGPPRQTTTPPPRRPNCRPARAPSATRPAPRPAADRFRRPG
ncbi:hypothetical protein MOQ_005709 [Trypanosoma cruzi marinkellei]|uniref:Uncharacterized protein n=1 Tax=Trypanosoma cruzi marinkellei TaxID=85056 RepID=K2MXF9_TRYCR|nr:hypothetical protein MOQ_005709 [Trypanosoma cruzi marinkellei]